MDKYFDKRVRIIDVDGKTWTGLVVSYEPPEDSENGKWWLDIKVENIKDFGELTICDDEIKKIQEISNN